MGLFGKSVFQTQPDFSACVDLKNLHRYLVAFVDLIGNFGHPVTGKLGYVHQPVDSRQDLDNCPKIHHFADLSLVNDTDLGLSGQCHDVPFDIGGDISAGSEDHYLAGIVDVDLDIEFG